MERGSREGGALSGSGKTLIRKEVTDASWRWHLFKLRGRGLSVKRGQRKKTSVDERGGKNNHFTWIDSLVLKDRHKLSNTKMKWAGHHSFLEEEATARLSIIRISGKRDQFDDLD